MVLETHSKTLRVGGLLGTGGAMPHSVTWQEQPWREFIQECNLNRWRTTRLASPQSYSQVSESLDLYLCISASQVSKTRPGKPKSGASARKPVLTDGLLMIHDGETHPAIVNREESSRALEERVRSEPDARAES